VVDERNGVAMEDPCITVFDHSIYKHFKITDINSFSLGCSPTIYIISLLCLQVEKRFTLVVTVGYHQILLYILNTIRLLLKYRSRHAVFITFVRTRILKHHSISTKSNKTREEKKRERALIASIVHELVAKISERDRNLIYSEFILKLLYSPSDTANLVTERSYTNS
jgi:hypothetical protein